MMIPGKQQGQKVKTMLQEWAERKFGMRERGTDFWTEVRAGTTTFLTLGYILLVNPQVMGEPHTGLARSNVVIGTAMGSIAGSFVVGYFGNLPFGMGPGLGLSAYLSYGLVKSSGLPWEGALATCTVAGIILLVMALVNLADTVMKYIPTTVKVATVIGMGLLLTFIGMQSIELVVGSGDDSLVKLGPMDNVNLWISMAGLLLLATLSHHRIQGAVLIGIFVVTVVIWFLNKTWPREILEIPSPDPEVMAAASDIKILSTHPAEYFTGVISFLLVGVFDVSGVIFGLACLAKLEKIDRDGNAIVPGSKWVFISAGIGTIVAAMFGCSPIICAIESAAGIKEGGRTGLTAIVVGLWFSLALIFAPLLGSIPQEATAPVVILIGASMMGQAIEIDWTEMKVAIPAFLTLTIMPFSFSISNGIAFGLGSYVFLYLTTGEAFKSSRPPLVGSSSITYGTLERGGSISDDAKSYMRSPNLILRSNEYADITETQRRHAASSTSLY